MSLEEYESMDDISIKIKNYKCFGESSQGFEEIKPINVLIGKNNSGKSSLIDLIEYAVKPRDLINFSHKGSEPEITITLPLKEDEVKKVFSSDTQGGEIGGNHWNFGKKFIGGKITIKLNINGSKKFVSLDPPLGLQKSDHQNRLVNNKDIPFSHKIFKRIRAERDVKAEGEGTISIDENGIGATDLIQQFINNAGLPRDRVKIKLLGELNKIVEPDARFSDIVTQRLDNGAWEIYLEDEQKGLIALSHSGSGLKTILLVLIFIFLVPFKEDKTLDNYIFALEEPENNLHPAVQRRLFLYLREFRLTP
ncbi:MAG: AAA family ATPase, partial [Methanosarcinales archaeon]|nr:AAA family ATPase [Methanosarcinales archaeon]